MYTLFITLYEFVVILLGTYAHVSLKMDILFLICVTYLVVHSFILVDHICSYVKI